MKQSDMGLSENGDVVPMKWPCKIKKDHHGKILGYTIFRGIHMGKWEIRVSATKYRILLISPSTKSMSKESSWNERPKTSKKHNSSIGHPHQLGTINNATFT